MVIQDRSLALQIFLHSVIQLFYAQIPVLKMGIALENNATVIHNTLAKIALLLVHMFYTIVSVNLNVQPIIIKNLVPK